MKKFLNFKLMILFLLTMHFAAVALAMTDQISEEESFDFGKSFTETDEIISSWFNGVTEGVDLFLVGKRMANRNKKVSSEIIVQNTTYSRESENFVNYTNISVNPRFPNLEAYWSLKFSTYDDTNLVQTAQGGYARQRPQDKKYAASIGLFRKLSNIRLAFQPRIELQDPLKVSHFLTAETVADMKTYQINPKFQLFADATLGTGTFHAFNFNFPIDDVYSLALLNEGEYEEKLNRYSVTNGISIGQVLTDTTSLGYGLTFFSNNRPTYHLNAYSMSLTWSEVIYKKLFDYRITPHLDFVRAEDYRGFVGIVFEFNFRF